MEKSGKKSFLSEKFLLVIAFVFVAIASELSDAKFLRDKSKRIHTFFDKDDDLFDLPEDEGQPPSFPTSTPDHQTTTDSLLTPLLVTAKQEDGVISSFDVHSTSESPENSPSGLFKGRNNSSKDLCTGIRCRVGRVCQADDEFSVAWCVCAGTGHCVDHGRRVCGSDGQFYFSHCELHRLACVKNQRIRVSHDERSCIRRLLETEAENYKRSLDSGMKQNSSLEFSDASNHRTHSSSTDRTTVGKVQNALLPAPKQDCTAHGYTRLMEKVLQQYCVMTGNLNCKRQQIAARSLLSYYDRNSDQQLDQMEINAMTLDLAEYEDHDAEKLRDSCRLRDVMKYYDQTDDGTLNLAELGALLGIPSLDQEETLRVFTVSATVGTSLEMKCDVVDTADYAWKRNGDPLADLTDNKIKVFDDGSLYISEVFLYHVGNYTCQKKSSGEIIRTHLVSIHVPPIVRVSPKIRFLVPRSTVTISCYAEGIPVPDVSWTANDLPLPNKPDHYALMHNGLSLQIRDVDYSIDTGTFKCRADNLVGLSEDVATIFIESDVSVQRFSSDELNELFVVFHADGFTVYEPGHCHMHHVVRGDYRVESRGAVGSAEMLCGSNATCEWGAAVNVKNAFVYASQPKLNRIVVIELQDRFNPTEIIAVDENPQRLDYVEHLDQVWVSCETNTESLDDVEALKTLMIIQRASADVRHSVIHTQPIMDQFDEVRGVFLPPANAFKQTFDYGFVLRSGNPSLHKIDLNTMTYVKELDMKSAGDCVVNRVTFVPLAGKIFVSCKDASNVATVAGNVASPCFTIDYVTDKIANTTIACGDSFVSPDSRHLVVIADNRRTLQVYHIEDDGSIEPAFDKEIDLHIGELTFTESERGYDLFANSPDKSDMLYMNLASGYMEIIKGEGNTGHSSRNNVSEESPKTKTYQPIVSGGIFSDYVLTPSTDTIRVIDTKRRHVQCVWQEINSASVAAWVEVASH